MIKAQSKYMEKSIHFTQLMAIFRKSLRRNMVFLSFSSNYNMYIVVFSCCRLVQRPFPRKQIKTPQIHQYAIYVSSRYKIVALHSMFNESGIEKYRSSSVTMIDKPLMTNEQKLRTNSVHNYLDFAFDLNHVSVIGDGIF